MATATKKKRASSRITQPSAQEAAAKTALATSQSAARLTPSKKLAAREPAPTTDLTAAQLRQPGQKAQPATAPAPARAGTPATTNNGTGNQQSQNAFLAAAAKSQATQAQTHANMIRSISMSGASAQQKLAMYQQYQHQQPHATGPGSRGGISHLLPLLRQARTGINGGPAFHHPLPGTLKEHLDHLEAQKQQKADDNAPHPADVPGGALGGGGPNLGPIGGLVEEFQKANEAAKQEQQQIDQQQHDEIIAAGGNKVARAGRQPWQAPAAGGAYNPGYNFTTRAHGRNPTARAIG
jgi:hypothetical protein